MTAQIRDYNPSTDADRVAQFYNRNHYGPARDEHLLTGTQLNLVLAERGVHLFLIAEDRGRIVGTIGYLRVSGRRLSRDDELFAGMFVIDPGYRAGFLAGRLFTSSFSRLLEDGIASLRVEVNPANVRAFPLYIRVGFRSAVPQPQPDQDGYIELVSHLPGVVSRLLHELASDVPLADVFTSFSWRTMAGGRNRSISHGVSTGDDGEVLVEYDFAVRGESIRVTVRMEDGGRVATTIDGVGLKVPAVAPAPVAPATAPPASAETRTVAVGQFSVEVDVDGTVSVRHPAYLGAVYRDALASVASRPLAWRRPLPQRPHITEHRGGWLLVWQVDDVRLQKQILIDEAVVTTVVRSEPSYGLVAEPWSSIRGSLVRSVAGESEQFRTPNVPGVWPRDAIDFEGSQLPQPCVAGRRTIIDEPVSGIRLEFEWLQAEAVRIEGQTLGRATTTGSELRYSLTLGVTQAGDALCDTDGSTGSKNGSHPDGIGWVSGPRAPTGPAVRAADASNWRSETRGGQAAVVSRAGSGSELVVAPERGIASWRVDGHDVLTSPFPSSRTLGPLGDWGAGLWVSSQGPREDLEHGVGWGGAPRVAYRTAPAENELSWSVDVLDDSVSRLRLNLLSGGLPSDHEVVAHLTPRVWGPTVFVAAHPTGWWAVERTARRWSSFARAARIPLDGDRVLSIVAHAAGDELLVRSSADSFLVSLVSRAKPLRSSWSLSVEGSEAPR